MTAHRIAWRRDVTSMEVASRRLPLSRWLARRRQDETDASRAAWLVETFREVCWTAGLCQDTESCAGIPGSATPTVSGVCLGGIERLTIQMRAGQKLSDFERVASRLAEGLRVSRVRFRQKRPGTIVIELLRVDPLDSPVEGVAALTSAADPFLVGQIDTGEYLRVALSELAHIIVQGQTRSGKSRWTYAALAQYAGAPDVLICGSDVTGILLRPFVGTRHDQYLALGSGDVTRHAEALEALVAEMDARIARMPERLDVFPCTPVDPYLLTVIEEMPGLLRAAAAYDAANKKDKTQVKPRILAAYGRLIAEGAKVGVRLLIIAQRADADIVGGFERGQAPLRLSFRVDKAEAVRMLHPAAATETCEEHLSCPAGRALISAPELPAVRMRSPHQGDYGAFLDQVRSLAPVGVE